MSYPELRRTIPESLALDGNCRDDEEQVGIVGLFAGGGDQRVTSTLVGLSLMLNETSI